MSKPKKLVPTRTDVFDDFIDSESEAEAVGQAPSQTGLDTSGWFQTDERKPRRVAMTFTLNPEVIGLIDKAAEKHKISRSRIIEKIALKTLT